MISSIEAGDFEQCVVALVDKITVNTDMANRSTAVSIRSFNPGPDRRCAHTGWWTDEQQLPGCQVG